ncbi:3-oxoacyl-[acyl-carrier-protein] reductase FabG [Methylobacterium crusticola]|uniref:3-oxoacyl-[acyl-carrier-protein] reductase FabG n=2 Tax=Methylobacterium crusticola TaxID=1697972 RepID=A0ABQ4QSL0_9HYPH|nr:SDR family oxidoreductase [Methylobacterium crusticola]GJD48315.1 3-oxoacyl-[acyl-carrier-protein] reductase FabG [Methylobacterium crusticola]
MDLHLRDRTCLVTGASSGIGRATAVLLAAEGGRVVATARTQAAQASLAEEIAAAGGAPPVLLAADFAREGAAGRLARQVLDQVGPVDVLVNNAGGSRPMTAPDDPAAWEGAFRLNFALRFAF